MANPIQPVGGNDILESAREQDAERRQRDVQDHYQRTGERLPLYQEPEVLVPISGYEPPDVASDGDMYSETRISRGRRSSDMDETVDELFGRGYAESCRNNSEVRQSRDQALQAEALREQQRVQRDRDELEALRQESKSRFKNAIAGLEVDEDEG